MKKKIENEYVWEEAVKIILIVKVFFSPSGLLLFPLEVRLSPFVENLLCELKMKIAISVMIFG